MTYKSGSDLAELSEQIALSWINDTDFRERFDDYKLGINDIDNGLIQMLQGREQLDKLSDITKDYPDIAMIVKDIPNQSLLNAAQETINELEDLVFRAQEEADYLVHKYNKDPDIFSEKSFKSYSPSNVRKTIAKVYYKMLLSNLILE